MSRRDEYLKQIYRDYIPPLRTYIDLNFPMIRQDREDTLQDVLEKLVSRIYRYDDRYALSTWIYTVARNHCLDLLRKQKGQPSFSGIEDDKQLASTAVSPESQMEKGWDQERMRYLLSRLPSDERQVLFLKYFEDMTFRDIGRVMRKPVGTVKYLSSKAKSWIESHWEADV